MNNKMMPMMVLMIVILLLGVIFVVQGSLMHMEVPKEEAKFHMLQEQYFSQSKSVRDGAAANSALNKQLVKINQYPSQLLELKLVGVGKILTGIFLILINILFALTMMPMRLSEVMMGMKMKK